MEFISKNGIISLSNIGVVSRQLLNPDNSQSNRVTITEVHLEPFAKQSRHSHQTSEQIWYAIKGTGLLLLSNNEEKEFSEGDVVRFAEGDIHGLLNNSDKEFIYISVTTPPINFEYAYKNKDK
ncbi:MAG: cupin domain-containing protein [Clostridium sp.]|nr:cupin domain-containing protein [Clostridium sp.]